MTHTSRPNSSAPLALLVICGVFGSVITVLLLEFSSADLSSTARISFYLLCALMLLIAGLALYCFIRFHRNKLPEEISRDAAMSALSIQEEEIRRLSRVVEQTDDSVVITDRLGEIEYVNPSFERQTGYTMEEVRGLNPRILRSGRHDHAFYAQLWNTILAGKPYSNIIVNRKKDGTIYYEQKTITPLRDADGRINHFVATSKDITAQRKAEEEEHQREARFRAIYEHANMGIAQVDMRGDVVMCNKVWCALLGQDEADAKGMSLRSVAASQSIDRLWELFGDLATGKQDGLSMDLDCQRRDGSLLQVAMILSLVRGHEGEPLFVIALLQDLTQRRQQEEQLKKAQLELEQRVAARTIELRRTNYSLLTEVSERASAEAGLKAIAAALPDAAFIAEESGVIETVLTAASPIPGRKPETIVRRNVLELLPEPTAQVFAAAIKDTFASGKSQILEYSLTSNGKATWFEARTAPLLLNAGGRKLVVFLVRDITRRMEAEDALKSALTELRRSNRDLDQFASIASHDLQEPLRMVSSYLQLIEQDYKGKLDAQADEFIGYAVDGAKRMNTLITDLLAYSRVGRETGPFVAVDANQVLADTLSTLKLTIRDSQAKITHDALPVVLGDATQLGQLFQNLIANAIKFHGDEDPLVHVSAVRAEVPGLWLFSVSDNGIGIPAADFERIFEIFQRLHNRRKYAGSGIGLAICQRIVELHNGLIWVESTPGNGTTFFFTLPDIAQ